MPGTPGRRAWTFGSLVDTANARLLKLRTVLDDRHGKPSWPDVKVKLADFDRPELISLVQDLYASKDNQAFLHARFGLGDDVRGTRPTVVDMPTGSRWR